MDELKKRIRAALAGVTPRRPALFELQGRDVGTVRIMLTDRHDDTDIAERLTRAGLSFKRVMLGFDVR